MTKSERQDFIEWMLMVLRSGLELKRSAQVRATVEALARVG